MRANNKLNPYMTSTPGIEGTYATLRDKCSLHCAVPVPQFNHLKPSFSCPCCLLVLLQNTLTKLIYTYIESVTAHTPLHLYKQVIWATRMVMKHSIQACQWSSATTGKINSLLTNYLTYVEGGCLEHPGAFTVTSQASDRILSPWLVNSRNPTKNNYFCKVYCSRTN